MLYDSAELFPIGGSKVLRSGPDDAVTLIGAGVTLHACLDAADQLGGQGIQARVIDLYSVKPIDTETLSAAVAATGGRLVVAEDHYPAGGLGSAVSDALLEAGSPVLHLAHLCVRDLPGSAAAPNCWPRPASMLNTSRPPRASWRVRPELVSQAGEPAQPAGTFSRRKPTSRSVTAEGRSMPGR